MLPTMPPQQGLPAAAAMRADPHGLAALAIEALVAQAARPVRERPVFHPVVLVSAAETVAERCLADLASAAATAGAAAVVRWSGETLGTAITAALRRDSLQAFAATFSAARLVIIAAVERIGPSPCQRGLGRLLDIAAARGTAACVSIRANPSACPLDVALESRLSAGLVVPLAQPGRADTCAPTLSGAAPTFTRVIRVTAAHCGMPIAAVIGTGRQRSVVHARSLAMYLSRRLTGRSLDAIGRAFGGRDHTTVLRSVRAIDALARRDVVFAGDVDRLARLIVGRGSRTA